MSLPAVLEGLMEPGEETDGYDEVSHGYVFLSVILLSIISLITLLSLSGRFPPE